MNNSVIVTAYNDAKSLKLIIPELLKGDFKEIIIAAEGNDGTASLQTSFTEDRLHFIFQVERQGKIAALKRALSEMSGDAIFIISSDTHFEIGQLENMCNYLTDGVGAVIPRIVPKNRAGFWESIASLIWDVRNAHLAILDNLGKPLHGGEVLLVRSEVIKEMADVINDDAYICLRAQEMGFLTRYAQGITISNRVPGSFHGILVQRTRINMGHNELRDMCLKPTVMNSALLTEPKMFLEVMRNVIKERKKNAFILPFAVLLELFSIFLSFRNDKKGRDMHVWPLAE